MNTLTFQRETNFKKFKRADETTKRLQVYAGKDGGWITGEVCHEPRAQHRKKKILLNAERGPGTGIFLSCDHPTIHYLFIH